ncbi:MAG: inositol monophosphatase [Prevotella sp.]|nr:inositol monophosphatase [Candidatus Equicola faecalis]
MIKDISNIIVRASELMLSDDIQIEQKNGFADIVTSSDIAVQDFLRSELSRLLPDSGFLCEEEDHHNLKHEYNWIIDPIDGTANYSRGIKECAICVGLKHFDEITHSTVYLPRASEMFTAEKGKGAFLNGRPIHVSNRPFQDALLCTALSVYHKEHAQVCSEIIVDAFQRCNDIRRFGAAAPELCYIAMGRCEMYFEYILSPWDFAAASLILKEAGGVMCDLDGNIPDPTLPTGLIAANTLANLQQMLEIVMKHRSNHK